MSDFDSSEWRAERNAKLLLWMNGHQPAADFILQLGDIAELWDDLLDADKGWPLPSDANRVFVTALFHLPSNPFYRDHFGYLQPLMMAGVNAWLDSTKLEHESSSWSKTWAYALRDWYMELVPACAMLIGGFDHMRAVSLEARRFFQAETLEQYLESRNGHPA